MERGVAYVPRLLPMIGAVVVLSVVTITTASQASAPATSPTTSPLAAIPSAARSASSLASPAPVTAVAPGVDLVAGPDGWRALAEPVIAEPRRTPDPALVATLGVTVVDAVLGDVDRDGDDEVVVVFVRPARPTLAGSTLATPVPSDAQGRTLHLGVYDGDLHQQWVAGTVLRPIAAVAVCDGTIVLAHSSSVGATDRVGVGTVRWSGYGFTTSPDLPDLPGDGAVACADVDGDRMLDPIVLGRSAP
jgi:hypothetical protein